jgi:hypothetical protein
MAIVVVGGSGRGVGKTALVCGVMAALPEFAWIAVKVTTHAHSNVGRVYEETAAGQGSDTARYLAAGARRAFLLRADDSELEERLSELGKLLGAEASVIFESNRGLRHLRPDLCLAIAPEANAPRKASFALIERCAQAMVRKGERGAGEECSSNGRPIFTMEEFEHISQPMQGWLRGRLRAGGCEPSRSAKDQRSLS